MQVYVPTQGASLRAGPLNLLRDILIAHMWMNLREVEAALGTRFAGRRLIYHTSCGSTQDIARQEAEGGAAEGTVVVAEEQMAGRGRFGRRWVSPAGKNIYFTLILRPEMGQLRRLGMITPLAVCEALEEMTTLSPAIKWPNDLQIGGRKFGGVLIESELSGAASEYALVGIGINVNFDVSGEPEIAAIATSLMVESGKALERELLLASMINRLEALYLSRDATSVHDAWKARLETLGQQIAVSFRGESWEGVAEDVDEHGSLLLRCPDGELMTFEAGEVSLRS